MQKELVEGRKTEAAAKLGQDSSPGETPISKDALAGSMSNGGAWEESQFIESKSKQAEEGEADDAEEETAEKNKDPDKQFQIFLSQHRLW